ncbi:hypothetical protein [Haloferax sp. Q22]|uniref:hypothetical protein n=1 Tax=Haloferax sp. (strain Q22) TaxID=1526048 RepID=UPI000737B118|nr:hypothetical protein [Haloferax sp. Q22]
MEDEVADVRKLSQLLAVEEKYGYVDEEETWLTAQFDEDEQRGQDSVKFFFVATPVDGTPYVLTHSQFQDLAEKGAKLHDELPSDIERKAYTPENRQEPDEGGRYVLVLSRKTVYK